ncbi:MAG: HEAT repeat domain-containing protein [Candidatus Solibacter usitatus]|nr:HEAT repeat domain-containing protein [Candidatus Solibacter usitatus]
MDPATTSKRPGKKAYLLITLFAVLLTLFPFLFWYGTWFGRKLTDQEIGQLLADPSKPRKAQHALVQLGERMSRSDVGARQFYPRVIEQTASSNAELRQTAAWIMGQDRSYAPFQEALRKLLLDSSPMVRRNAALSLSTFGDAAGRPELRAMLRSQTIASPAAGVVRYRLKTAEYVNPGTLVAHVGATEVRASLPGEVVQMLKPEGAAVASGDPLLEISADKDHAWEALRALLALGNQDDLEDVQRYARGVAGMPERVRQQAVLTLHEIQGRVVAGNKQSP